MQRTSKDVAKAIWAKKLILDLNVYSKSNNLPDFGPALAGTDGSTACEVTIVHRILSKLEVPLDTDESQRRLDTIRSALAVDGSTVFCYSDDLRMAKARLGVMFKSFRPTYAFVPPKRTSAFDDGVSTSLVHKLSNTAFWEVSLENLDYASTIAYTNKGLKAIVKNAFRTHIGSDWRTQLDVIRHHYTSLDEKWQWYKMHGGDRPIKPGCIGYYMFRFMFSTLCTINSVTRLETVPKNNTTDRMIGCVPFWDMVCQLSYMQDIRKYVLNEHGIDVELLQDYHRHLIQYEANATIDLKSASDLVTWELVRTLWPERMLKDLENLRPKVASYVESDGTVMYHHFTMFAPMGCGLTFDIMTFTLRALLGFDRYVSVFGDDIIVGTEYAARALATLKNAGLLVNVSKSFTSGKFRESCGGFFHMDYGYITSFDVKYPKDRIEEITVANKLWILKNTRGISPALKQILQRAHWGILDLLPDDLKSSIKPDGLTSTYAFSEFANTKYHVRPSNMEISYQRRIPLTWGYQRNMKKIRHPYSLSSCVLFYLTIKDGLTPIRYSKRSVLERFVMDCWSGAKHY